MRTPVTEFNPRYSGPDATEVPWSEARQVLERARSYWISTVRSDGRPHVTPLVGVWHEDAMFFTTGPEERKARNLLSNPWCALTTGSNDWNEGFDVVLEGEAHRISDDQRLRVVADTYRSKYGDAWSFQVDDGMFVQHGRSIVFELLPVTVFGFGKGPFSQTRYRFETESLR